ncbi:GNAT family N-acetyltransferase [Ameyamaea chiangmaiensis]|uniref:GNAT family N-acetyltransferase n=2 Tax=Ameyamaea chiangmaiensis TaxID=442969 RepID=A0A850PEC6_9PROT|nr:GNAT family N-acetyltransferase [Ameyamaea chiangmaiensis]NVN40616.1 GNAT family N-acetyltransferase [Ameyamaea chiangmaiensis]
MCDLPTPPVIRPADFDDPATRDLLALHLSGMHANTPSAYVFALDLNGLQAPDMAVWTAWFGDTIAGVGALRTLATDAGEIKSMRTHPDCLRRGVGRALLAHIVTAAQDKGMTRLSLETGRGAAFEPAIALYRRFGFVEGAPFGGYEAGPFSRFFHRTM